MTTTKPVTRTPIKMNLKKEEAVLFPPRDAEEAKSRGVFVSTSGITYCHFNGTIQSDVVGEKGTTVMMHAYGELADKIGELLVEAVKSAKKQKDKRLAIQINANVEISPIFDNNGELTGNNVETKIYGFSHNGYYYTTSGGMLIVREEYTADTVTDNTKVSKISFF